MNDKQKRSVAELLSQMQKGWDEFNTYLSSLTEEQMTVPTDAAGWTAKDHIMHLALWEQAALDLLHKRPLREAMGISREMWEGGDIDAQNAFTQQRYEKLPLKDVLRTFHDTHQRLVKHIRSMEAVEMERPYSFYDPDATEERTAWEWAVDNTFGHYEEHRPWIQAIIQQSTKQGQGSYD